MRTSNDIYKTIDGELLSVPQTEETPQGAKLWNGYDYENQYWVYEGKRDTRSLEELRATRKCQCGSSELPKIHLKEECKNPF